MNQDQQLREDWRDRALCRQADPRLFDPLDGAELRRFGCHPTSHARIRQAMSVCESCPVDCGKWAEAAGATGVCAGRYRAQGEASRSSATLRGRKKAA